MCAGCPATVIPSGYIRAPERCCTGILKVSFGEAGIIVARTHVIDAHQKLDRRGIGHRYRLYSGSHVGQSVRIRHPGAHALIPRPLQFQKQVWRAAKIAVVIERINLLGRKTGLQLQAHFPVRLPDLQRGLDNSQVTTGPVGVAPLRTGARSCRRAQLKLC